ncbi:MAG TPA: methyltransferase domain-containing protein [Burkholderiales bacterium]|nr:methyltransferase domain-containing protein [Burkholderiales bacterium]
MRAGLPLLAVWALATPLRAQEVLQQAPFFTTPREVVSQMLLLARAGPGDTVMDLGAGDGRIVIQAAVERGAQGLGVELDASLVERARANARRAGVADRVRFRMEDLMRADLSGATVITAYLVPYQLERLEPRLLAGPRPGTRIVTHYFSLPNWPQDAMREVQVSEDGARRPRTSRIFLYVVPAQARGEWRAADGWQLRIEQNFQKIEVRASREGTALAVSSARLAGERIDIGGPDFSLSARVADGRIVGELAGGRPVVFERAR